MKFDKDKYSVYEVIAHGMLSNPKIGNGKFLPAIVLDKSIAKDVDELSQIHKTTPPGDIETVWTQHLSILRPKEFILKLKFTKPMDLTFGISFNIKENHNLIDGILESQAILLQLGNIGEKVSEVKSGGIIMEVPNTNFKVKWEKILEETIKQEYKKKGVNKKDLKKLVKEHIRASRELWNAKK